MGIDFRARVKYMLDNAEHAIREGRTGEAAETLRYLRLSEKKQLPEETEKAFNLDKRIHEIWREEENARLDEEARKYWEERASRPDEEDHYLDEPICDEYEIDKRCTEYPTRGTYTEYAEFSDPQNRIES